MSRGSADGIAGDDTHGHVDDLVPLRGSAHRRVVPRDRFPDANYRPLEENRERLEADACVRGWHEARGGLAAHAGARASTRACAFRQATRTSTSRTPRCSCRPSTTPTIASRSASSRSYSPIGRVIGIHAVDLVWGLGTIHRLTQQGAGTLGDPHASVWWQLDDLQPVAAQHVHRFHEPRERDRLRDEGVHAQLVAADDVLGRALTWRARRSECRAASCLP